MWNIRYDGIQETHAICQEQRLGHVCIDSIGSLKFGERGPLYDKWHFENNSPGVIGPFLSCQLPWSAI